MFIDQSYSVLDNMTHGLQMSKLFSKSFYDAAKATEPFWLKGNQVPEDGDITLVTAVTPGTWNELERLASYWKGKYGKRKQDRMKLMMVVKVLFRLYCMLARMMMT